MVNKYFKILYNYEYNSSIQKIICLFINNKEQRNILKETIEFNTTTTKTVIKDKKKIKTYLLQDEIDTLGKTTNICISDYPLYDDDTIEELKIKLYFTLKTHKIEVSTDEMYIYSNSFSSSVLTHSKTNTTDDKVDYLYRVLSNNKKTMITWDMLCEFFLNCGTIGVELLKNIDKKMYYFYDDLNQHKQLIEKITHYNTSLSHYLTTSKKRLFFPCNPDTLALYFNDLLETTTNIEEKKFNIKDIQNKFYEVPKLITENTSELLTTNNSKCLYDFTIDNQTLYIYSPFSITNTVPSLSSLQNKAVLNHIVSLFSSYYFPKTKTMFSQSGILNLEKYNDTIKSDSEKYKNKAKYDKYFDKLNIIYSLNSDTMPKKNTTTYIKNLSGTYYQAFPFLFPCESIFKKVKTNQIMPYVKYNPGQKQENINRLYVSGLSQKGQKVPYLTKTHIKKLNSKIGIRENVLYYFAINKSLFNDYKSAKTLKYTKKIMEQLNNKIPEGNYDISLVIYNDSSVSYHFSCNDTTKNIGLSEIELLIDVVCNPVLLFIQNELVSMGPVFNIMETFENDNFELQTVNLELLVNNLSLSQLNFNKYETCISNFITRQEKLKKATKDKSASFMYKRISNYTKLNAIESSIIQFINVGYGEESIVRFLMTNYGIDEIEAKESFLNILSQINIERSLNSNRRLKIKNNPGLVFDLVDVPFSNKLIVSINNINSLKLLEIVDRNTKKILITLSSAFDNEEEEKTINKLCKQQKGKEKEDTLVIQGNIKDNTAVVEKSIDRNEPSDKLTKNLLDAKMNAEAITFDDIDELQTKEAHDDALDDDLMDMLLDEEDSEGLGDIDDFNDIDDLIEMNDNVEGSEDDESSKSNKDEELDDESSKSNKDEELDELDMMGGNDGKTIEGMNLTNPNPFFDKMNYMDPKLFLKKKTGQFNAYSRMCPWNVKRQPVILTQEELDKIDKEHPGSYNKKIKYGSSEDKEYYYICPRYWCLKDNVSLTEEEVKSGACGGVDAIIPKNAKKVPPGKYIFEFYADSQHKEKDGSYIEHYPGFLSGDKHPDGLCVPCCFKAWDSELQKKRRKECTSGTRKDKKEKGKEKRKEKSEIQKGDKDAESEDDKRKTIKIKRKKSGIKDKTEISEEEDKVPQYEQDDNYIIGVDKFPLPNKRWGMLPIEIQTFLNINNNDCFEDVESHKLKQDTKCILRQGIELSQNKSFIGALANVYASFSDTGRILSINSMSKYIASAITLDHFIEAQNGSLVSMFFNPRIFKKIDQKEMETYKNTTIYKLTDFNTISQQLYLRRAISAFKRFTSYLKNEKSYVNHEILWDLVSMPNDNLFNSGLNLVILNIPDDDMTNNVEIICPSNAYSSMFYNPRKFTLILIKKNDFYEPIYTYEETKKQINIQKIFNEFIPTLLPKLKEFIETIKEFIVDCQSKQNVAYSKVFEKGNTLNTLVRIINKNKGNIVNYVINNSKKIVGVIVDFERNEKKYENIYIPCFPSSLNLSTLNEKDEAMLITYDDVKSLTLEKTITGLSSFHGISSKINCQPYAIVEEDEMFVGIITNTNQFVPIEPISNNNPQTDKYKNKMKIISSHSNGKINKLLTSRLEITEGMDDTSDIKNMDDISDINVIYDKYKLSKLEQVSFQKYRNKIKVLLQKPKFHKEKEKIMSFIETKTLSYKHKMKKVIETIQKVIKGEVEFYDIKDFKKYNEKRKEKINSNYYYIDDIKNTILPKQNLNDPSVDNSVFYVERIADEIIRFTRIYDFLLNNQYNVGYSSIDYNLRENELLIPSSELEQSFFGDIANISKYYDVIYSLDFYNAQPQEKININNVVERKKKIKRKINIKRKITEKEQAQQPQPQQSQPQQSQQPEETELNDNNICKITKSDTLRLKWKLLLGSKFKSNIYNPNVECSYQILIDIIKTYTNQEVNTYDLISKLITIYKSLTSKEKSEIVSMLSHDGKIEFARKVKSKTIKLEELPMLKEYYLSLPDILLLSREYKLPLIIITSGKFNSLKTNVALTTSLKLNKDGDKITIPKSMDFFIIKKSGVKRNEPFIYELFVSHDDIEKLNINMFKKKFVTFLEQHIENLKEYKFNILNEIIY